MRQIGMKSLLQILLDVDSVSIQYFLIRAKISIFMIIVSRNVMVCKINKDWGQYRRFYPNWQKECDVRIEVCIQSRNFPGQVNSPGKMLMKQNINIFFLLFRWQKYDIVRFSLNFFFYSFLLFLFLACHKYVKCT